MSGQAPQTVAEVLEETIRLLEQHGRAKGIDVAPDGSMCLFAAMRVAAGLRNPDDSPVRGLDWKEFNRRSIVKGNASYAARSAGISAGLISYVGEGLVSFNDRPETTDEQVYELLRTAIAQLS